MALAGRPLRARLGPAGGRLGLAAALAAAVFLLDQGSKLLAVHLLSGEPETDVLGGLVELELFRNFAGPNNILPGHTALISVIGLVAVAVLLVAAYRVVSTPGAVAVGLLLGGALGNLLDRLLREPGPLRGGVIDWLRIADLTNSMNLADLAIHAGVVILIILVLLSWRHDRDGGRAEPTAELDRQPPR